MKKLGKSPLAPVDGFPTLPPIAGVQLTGVSAGIKGNGQKDLMLVTFAPFTQVAGVFTQSKTCAPPVDWCRDCLRTQDGIIRALLVTSGCANACTGQQGIDNNKKLAETYAKIIAVPTHQVYTAATGAIGTQIPSINTILGSLPALAETLSPTAFADAADSIMTTDTFAKGASITAEIAGTPIKINGIAKGSGMIAPNMATMLSFIFTDAALPSDILQKCVNRAVQRSFNCISVDGDTSTNDTVIVAATAAAQNMRPKSADETILEDFSAALEKLMIDLAQQIVRDGEGASKFITVRVDGAENDAAARNIAFAIANSPLVKTAIAGEDANWGRIVMAVGKAGEVIDPARLSIAMGGITVAHAGDFIASQTESDQIDAHLKETEIDIAVNLGIGRGQAKIWTCDLTHAYITINADYRS